MSTTAHDGRVFIHPQGSPEGGIPVDGLTGVTLADASAAPVASLDLIQDGARITLLAPDPAVRGGMAKVHLDMRRFSGGWALDVRMPDEEGDGPPVIERVSNFTWLLTPGTDDDETTGDPS